MITCERADELLDDFLNGTLDGAAGMALQDHLAACPSCAEAEADLRRLLARAGGLPREIEPPRDLWPGIEGRLERRTMPRLSPTSRLPGILRFAAAAALLVALTSAATLWLVRREPEPVAPPPVAWRVIHMEAASLKVSEPHYLQARSELRAALQAKRDSLSPQTLEVIDENLEVMDRALRAMKIALDKDPGNRGLAVLIESTYRQELNLLMRASRLPAKA